MLSTKKRPRIRRFAFRTNKQGLYKFNKEMLKHDLHAWGVTFSIIFVVIDTCYHSSAKKT